ncbi:MlaA family lipoprotein [Desulfosoma caldarium]|uniref:Phospholipid-binding lipoprotein MlaA n=1 Tax=Desulfosoma caldarium TaxID=610254 RepID=A0A3N1UR51_9BACT|nr:VacJ family lipoprotein [Desulfosoma caldarium]ROQ93585.1 phospholipid-binding lipoprotein MlaA [Desulfosoma caldarium]
MKCKGRWVRLGMLLGMLTFLSTVGSSIRISFPWTTTVWGTPAAWAASEVEENEFYMDDPFAEEQLTVADPLRPLNRFFFHFNDKLYFWVLKPLATVYKTFVPTGVRLCVRNAFDNLMAPVRIANNALQLKFQRSGIELARFALNTTLGVGGLFDPAQQEFGLKPYDEDFGQTLGRYGLGNGIFFMWPVLGPSTLRDTVGLVGDYFLDPLSYLSWEQHGVAKGVQQVNRASLTLGEYEDFKASAVDPYVSMRDAYVNYRHRQVKK